jgi:hypothetical protein
MQNVGGPHSGVSGTADLYKIVLDGKTGTITAGGQAGPDEGKLVLNDRGGATTALLEGRHGNLTRGGNGAEGDITLKNGDDVATITLNADQAHVVSGASGSMSAAA